MDNKFFAFFEPVWDYIDNGKFYREPFRLLYVIMAVLNALFPLWVIYEAVDSGVFDYISGGAVFAMILAFLVLIFLGAMSFCLWFNRQEKVKNSLHEDHEFVAIPVVSHFIQTLGEWFGFYLGVGGCLISFLFTIFGQNDSLGNLIPVGTSVLMIIMYPVTGFLIVVTGRLIAEIYRALASIANNTKKFAESRQCVDTPEVQADADAASTVDVQ